MADHTHPIVPLILCGGQGSRLWPLSRKSYPKQFLELTPGGSLLQETVKRIAPLRGATAPLVICNETHYFMTREQLHHIGIQPAHIILEPVGKNTAPAIAIAALQAIAQFGGDPLLLVMPADHYIEDTAHFQRAVLTASQQATNHLLTFGIEPAAPKTGYGYIKKGDCLSESVFRVAQFTEKPNLATATEYCQSGSYLWNSGMFLFHANTYLKELKQHAAEIFQACEQAFHDGIQDDDYLRLPLASFQACPEDSIDYAVMEKTDHAAVLPIDCGWADMGDWTTIAEVQNGNEQGNVIKGDVLVEDVTNSCIYADHRLVAAVGIKDHVVIETKDAVLIADKARTQDVKRIVSQLKQLSHQAAEDHHRVQRPWGFYETLIRGEGYLVKHIMVKPDAQLSLQMHHHRAEHWVVVNGTAEVVCDQNTFSLQHNESTFIPCGSKHRLSNRQDIPLHVIEVQTGNHLSEDDIVRFEDIYGRSQQAAESVI